MEEARQALRHGIAAAAGRRARKEELRVAHVGEGQLLAVVEAALGTRQGEHGRMSVGESDMF